MTQESEPLLSPYHNWPLMQGVLSILRESRVGLSCASAVELAMDRGLVEEGDPSSRGAYQRVYRALQQLEGMRLVTKQGSRFLVNDGALEQELAREAEEVLRKALEAPLISGNPEEVHHAFQQALAKILESNPKQA